MKQMASVKWSALFQKTILCTGYISLIAIIAGADVKIKKTNLFFNNNLLAPEHKTSSPLLIERCAVPDELNESAPWKQKMYSCKKKEVNSKNSNN